MKDYSDPIPWRCCLLRLKGAFLEQYDNLLICKKTELYNQNQIVSIKIKNFINPFNATGLFLYPLRTSENQRFSVFRGYRKRPVEMG